MSLREQLAEERQVLLNREAEKAVLEARIVRLTQIVLNSTRAMLASQPAAPSWPHSPPHETSASDVITRGSFTGDHNPPSLLGLRENSEASNVTGDDQVRASLRRERSTSSMARS
jgi:hypothetical protein